MYNIGYCKICKQGLLEIVKGKTGKCAGQLILTYEDADGKSYEE